MQTASLPLVRAEVSARAATKRPSRPFLGYVHSLRGLAILVVVGVHVAEVMGWEQARGLLARLIFALLGNATVMFVFVSGFLFQHLSQNFRYAPYLRKKLERSSSPTSSSRYRSWSTSTSGTPGCMPPHTARIRC